LASLHWPLELLLLRAGFLADALPRLWSAWLATKST
jgi:hypothetical protein